MADDEDDIDSAVVEGVAEDVLKQLEKALGGELTPLAPAVFVPPGVRMHLVDNRVARGVIENALKETYKLPTVDEQVVRIQREVDPIGMAMAIVQGMAIPVYVPKDGGVIVKYVQVSTRERMKLLKDLMGRVLPAEAPRKPAKPEDPNAGSLNPSSFLAMVEDAAKLARQRMIDVAPRNITPPDKSYREADLVVEATTDTAADREPT